MTYHWSQTAQPLLNFCLHPATGRSTLCGGESAGAAREKSLLHKVGRALRMGGPAGLWRQVVQYARWKTRIR
ncbi:MAG: hypothetical protein R2911_06730 [Caldilineaceae bacterium]